MITRDELAKRLFVAGYWPLDDEVPPGPIPKPYLDVMLRMADEALKAFEENKEKS